MSKSMVLLFSFTTMLMLLSCSTTEHKEENVVVSTNRDQKEQYPQAEIAELSGHTDPFKIISAEIKSNFLHLEVSYAGGCEKHDFKLVGEPRLSNTDPQQRAIQLQHVSNGDRCKAIVNEKLIFSISILSDNYKREKTVRLMLQNNGQHFDYQFE